MLTNCVLLRLLLLSVLSLLQCGLLLRELALNRLLSREREREDAVGEERSSSLRRLDSGSGCRKRGESPPFRKKVGIFTIV